jgi:hypothetical protein
LVEGLAAAGETLARGLRAAMERGAIPKATAFEALIPRHTDWGIGDRTIFEEMVEAASVSAQIQRNALAGGSTVRLWREVDALGGARDEDDLKSIGYSNALDDVLAILERRGFTEHADPLDELERMERKGRHDREEIGKLHARVRVVEGQRDAALELVAEVTDERDAARAMWHAENADHAALRQEIAQLRKLIDDAFPAVRLVNDWATWKDSSLFAYVDAHLARDRYALEDRNYVRKFGFGMLAEIRKVARGRLGDDGFRIPPTYGDAELLAAVQAIRAHFTDRVLETAQDVRELIEAVATALGMRKAGQ